MHWIFHIIRHALITWGYWAVVAGLLAENAGIPVPGETTLMFASFLAHKTQQLQLLWIVVAGTLASTAGDNIGFWLGRKLGRRLIRWMKKLFRLDDEDIGAAKQLMKKHGGRTVFFARFIFGLRTIAGPLAGMLDMEWKRFALFNVLGAGTWVACMALIGYEFASEFESLLSYFETASWAIAAGLFGLGYWLWRKHKKHYKQEHERKAA